MRAIYFAGMFVLTATFLANAQETGDEKLYLVDYDHARFQLDEESSLLEVYYSFYQNALTIFEREGKEIISGELSVYVEEKGGGERVVERTYDLTYDAAEGAGQTLTGVLKYQVPFGEYETSIVARDKGAEDRIDSSSFELVAAPVSEETFELSDLQLAANILEGGDPESIFYKNTMEVVPNPTSLYGEGLPVVFFYLEVYGADITDEESCDRLLVEHKLIDEIGQPVYEKDKVVGREHAAVVEVGAAPVAKLPTGGYTLYVAVTDTATEESVYSAKRVYVYNPNVVDSATRAESIADTDFLQSEFSQMGEEELEEKFNQSKYVSVSDEVDQWENLETLEAKRKFLFEFWKNRDSKPETEINEAKREYFERVAYAERNYDALGKPGWKTDRGRVYVRYGEPDEIERYPNQQDTKPYEIWHYNQIEGGVIFVFGDLTQFGNYMLLHSTMRGELYDTNWMQRIRSAY